MLYVNDLIEWIDDEGKSKVERIIWIDEHYVIAFVFNIDTNKGVPYTKRISEIEEAISEGLTLKLTSDPWLRIMREDNLSEKELKIRDRAWKLIADLVEQEPEIYDRKIRGSLVTKVIAQSKEKVIKKTIYNYLRKYWQRGKTKNSLLPDYSNSGGKGKTRKYNQDIKRGRPRKYKKVKEIGEGVNITEADLKIFRIAISKFYNNRKGNFLTTAYELMLKEYYNDEIVLDERGVRKSILIPPNLRPTIVQFRYWYEKEHRDVRKTVSSRRGSKAFELEHRAILGSSKQETIGPGSRYQIDATIADVYLVSKYNRNWIIGRPVVYIVIDVFSHMITGVYVGLEGPSWLGAMMAFVNAATDKVKYCAEYGIEITEEQWLAHHIPDVILTDRGTEFTGKSIETSINNLGIKIEHAPPYRGDRKGIVERNFKTIHGKVKPFIPGYVDVDFTQRGGKDYRLDSKLDLDEFTKAIIYLTLDHNNNHHLKNYARETAMIIDDVIAKPKELWQWGIANRSGILKTFPEDIIKLNLMPSGRAIITAKGIKFKKLYYTCDKARKEQWFERARSNYLAKDEKHVDVSYDPRKPEYIYLRSSDGKDYEKCTIVDFEGIYTGKTWSEIEYLFAYEKLQEQKYQGQETQTKVDLMAEFENIVKKAITSTDAVQDKNLSKSKKVKGIRDNRVFEKEKRREKEAFELGEDKLSDPAEQVQEVEDLELKASSKETKSDQSKQKTKSFKRQKLEALRRNRLKRSIKDE